MPLEIISSLSSSDKIATLSLIIAVFALLFSGITFFVYDKKLKKQDAKIQAFTIKEFEEKEKERQKALIRANVIKGNKGNRILKIYNAGKAVAKNVNLDMDIKDSIHFYERDLLPYEFLNPQEGIELHYAISSNSPDKIKIVLTWDDDSDANCKYEQIITP